MSMQIFRRIFGLVAIALLGGCGGGGDPLPAAEDRIECALGGASDFARHCWVERQSEGSSLYLTVRHEDGGFRRFEVIEGGRTLRAADGVETAQFTVQNGQVEVAVGSDRYLLPVTISADGTD